MDHARSPKFDPARLLANPTARAAAFETTEIKLCTRLSKWKIRRPEPRHSLRAKHAPQKLCNRSLQMRHRDPAVNAQAFDLEEHGIVSWIRRVATKDTAGRYHAQRRATPLHRMNLHRGGLRSQRKTFGSIKSVLGRARRMICRNIQRVEIVEVRFNFPIVFNCIAQ